MCQQSRVALSVLTCLLESTSCSLCRRTRTSLSAQTSSRPCRSSTASSLRTPWTRARWVALVCLPHHSSCPVGGRGPWRAAAHARRPSAGAGARQARTRSCIQPPRVTACRL
jgi:hypothetical protein